LKNLVGPTVLHVLNAAAENVFERKPLVGGVANVNQPSL
jgi:hypothetical protein